MGWARQLRAAVTWINVRFDRVFIAFSDLKLRMLSVIARAITMAPANINMPPNRAGGISEFFISVGEIEVKNPMKKWGNPQREPTAAR
jgi:hypothetical protein